MRKTSNNLDTKSILTDRGQRNKADILEQIKITDSKKGTIYILCPADLSERLYQHFRSKQIESTLPKRAIDGKNPDDELIVVTATLNEATSEVDEFVSNVVCFQREKLN